jgi:hypothetical protein
MAQNVGGRKITKLLLDNGADIRRSHNVQYCRAVYLAEKEGHLSLAGFFRGCNVNRCTIVNCGASKRIIRGREYERHPESDANNFE